MFPSIFQVCAADAAVKAALGTAPTKLFPAGRVPQGTAPPYATWQQVTGFPENYLGRVPDIDSFTVQVDVYANTINDARDAALAVRNAIEPVSHITSWRGESTDPDTLMIRYSFDCDWLVNR